jgi:hypothetical protein
MHVEKALFFVCLYIEAGRRDILLRKEVEGRRACSKFCLAKKMVMITDDVTPAARGTSLLKA